MHYLRKIILLSAITLLPVSAMADAPVAVPSITGGGTGGSGDGYGKNFDVYWNKRTNGKGVITKDEWQAESEKKFKQIDTNGDGKISKDEMMAYQGTARSKARARRAANISGTSGN